MQIMIPIIRPYGSINYRLIKGVSKSKRFKDVYYLIDTDYNVFRIDLDTYELLSKEYPQIKLKRKGV